MAFDRASLANELSRLVVEALVKIGLTERDVLGGAIVHTDLPWQVPPLVVEAQLFGVALSEYIDRPTYINIDAFINFFSDTLADMRNSPRKVLGIEGYKSLIYAVPQIKAVERGLHFSIPDGFPGAVSDYAGVTLALECAHMLRTNAKLVDFFSDDDTYCAVLPDGMAIGVRHGLPTAWPEQWDLPVSGMVQELLRQPRGAVWEGCDYNVISQVRSVCKVYERAIKGYEAVDWALQALRIIDGERAMLKAVRSLKSVAYERGARLSQLQQAVQVANAMALTDRQRIETLKNILVPDILTPAQFSKQLYGYYVLVPPVVLPKVLVRIQEAVQGLLEHEEMLYARVNPGKIL